jgi:anaerobic selenocysteine-containing dehydrogenase
MLNHKEGEQILTNCTTGGPVNVYVKEGKITRIEPLELSKDDATWAIEARGRKFSPENQLTCYTRGHPVQGTFTQRLRGAPERAD